jgi:hypothetical protein
MRSKPSAVVHRYVSNSYSFKVYLLLSVDSAAHATNSRDAVALTYLHAVALTYLRHQLCFACSVFSYTICSTTSMC